MYIDLETGVRVSEADMQNYADQEGLDIEEYISLMGFTLESDNNTSESADTSSADICSADTCSADTSFTDTSFADTSFADIYYLTSPQGSTGETAIISVPRSNINPTGLVISFISS